MTKTKTAEATMAATDRERQAKWRKRQKDRIRELEKMIKPRLAKRPAKAKKHKAAKRKPSVTEKLDKLDEGIAEVIALLRAKSFG